MHPEREETQIPKECHFFGPPRGIYCTAWLSMTWPTLSSPRHLHAARDILDIMFHDVFKQVVCLRDTCTVFLVFDVR